MSDHEAAPDPMDKAYVQAEGLLGDDDAARAARRERVLAAVARATPEAAKPILRPVWRRGGLLVAASVAAVSVLLATQIDPPVTVDKPTTPPPPAAPAITADKGSNAPRPAADGPSETPIRPPRKAAAAREAQVAAREMARVEPSPAPLQVARAQPEAPPAAAPAAPPADQGVSEVVVTGARVEAARAAPPPRLSKGSPSELAARLRDAAADGRTAEVAALLARGVPVDEPDGDGETALMKSIHANHPAAAALLRRNGASLERRNRAGESARDMAMSVGDPELDRALGLDR